MKKLIFGAMALLLFTTMVKAEDVDELAKKAVVDFLEAFKSNNPESAIKITGTPFYLKNQDLIKDKADLGKYISEEFKKNAGKVNDLAYSFNEIHAYENIKDQVTEDKEKINEVLKNGDRAVLMEVKIGNKESTVAFAVALRQGKALVVGVSKVSEK